MRKLLTLLLIFCLFLPLGTACQKEKQSIRIYTLNGTTGFGMAPLIADSKDGKTAGNYEFTVESDATVVRSALLAGDADMAALPTNVAASLYNATEGGVTVLALNTGGVLYVVSADSTLTSLAGLAGKTLYCPAQNPAFITEALLKAAEVQNITLDSTTYAAPDALRDALAAGLVEHAVLPEPMVTVAKNAAAREGRTLTVALDLTALWDEYFEAGSLTQGCLVVRTTFLKEHPEAVAEFLREYEASVQFVNENPEDAAEMIVAAGILSSAEVAKTAIPRCHLIFKTGEEMKTALSVFLSQMPLKSIGGKLPGDDFYGVDVP